MKRSRLWIAAFITALLLMFPRVALANIASGTYDNVSWRITDAGELIIGNGSTQTMTNRTSRTTGSWPWNSHYNDIKSIRISGTVNANGSLCSMFFRHPSGSISNTTIGYPNCTAIEISGLNVSGATSMEYMFCGMPNLETITMPSSFNSSRVINMNYMFCGCKKLNNLDVHHFQMQNVTTIGAMFWGCESLEALDVSSWNTQKVTGTWSTFRLCKKLRSLDVSKWKTSQFDNPYGMFMSCESLESLDVSKWDVSRCTHFNVMFQDCSALTELDVSGWQTPKLTSLNSTFKGCKALQRLDLSSWNTANVTTMNALFRECNSLQDVNLSGLNTSKLTRMDQMFMFCLSLKDIDLSSFDTRKVTTMNSLFQGCRQLEHVDISSFNTSDVTDMYAMFWDTKLESLDLSHFDTRNVTSIRCMLGRCTELKQLDISSFDTSKVTTMGGMFFGDTALTDLDLSHFITPNLTSLVHENADNRYGMFEGCTNLQTLDISGLNCSQVTEMDRMFENCKNLHSVTLGNQFDFEGNNIPDENRQALLLTPTDNRYTGKWIREDGAAGPLTAEELRDTYASNAGAYAGTWIWEEKPSGTILYHSPGAEYTGAMPNQTFFTSEDFQLAENNFHRPGYVFSHWNLIKVNDTAPATVTTFIDTIPADTFEAGAKIELQAVLEQRNKDLALEDGMFEFALTAGERIHFKDLPGGAQYQVWEETPAGWVLIKQTNAAGEITPTETIESTFVNKYIPGTATIQLNAAKTIDGHAPEADAFAFELLDEHGTVIETATNNSAGVVQFKTLTFTAPGTYTYKIREKRGEDAGINYDSHTEMITIEVTDNNGTLVAASSSGNTIPSFVNRTKPGVLKIRKTTDGKGTGEEEFTFEIRLANEYGQPLDSISAFTEK